MCNSCTRSAEDGRATSSRKRLQPRHSSRQQWNTTQIESLCSYTATNERQQSRIGAQNTARNVSKGQCDERHFHEAAIGHRLPGGYHGVPDQHDGNNLTDRDLSILPTAVRLHSNRHHGDLRLLCDWCPRCAADRRQLVGSTWSSAHAARRSMCLGGVSGNLPPERWAMGSHAGATVLGCLRWHLYRNRDRRGDRTRAACMAQARHPRGHRLQHAGPGLRPVVERDTRRVPATADANSVCRASGTRCDCNGGGMECAGNSTASGTRQTRVSKNLIARRGTRRVRASGGSRVCRVRRGGLLCCRCTATDPGRTRLSQRCRNWRDCVPAFCMFGSWADGTGLHHATLAAARRMHWAACRLAGCRAVRAGALTGRAADRHGTGWNWTGNQPSRGTGRAGGEKPAGPAGRGYIKLFRRALCRNLAPRDRPGHGCAGRRHSTRHANLLWLDGPACPDRVASSPARRSSWNSNDRHRTRLTDSYNSLDVRPLMRLIISLGAASRLTVPAGHRHGSRQRRHGWTAPDRRKCTPTTRRVKCSAPHTTRTSIAKPIWIACTTAA